ncbi:hypothetical protein AVEN_69736-1 [Araneus ventricosus]|uniref:Uncharacterized protein n=1 Tax=Araneus ventricosus TaxID=182803 RepID=A0A4Y2CYZ2_ARAVE|nr:hypothetical protein AVEN_69736-1 [Araneus ventricosus]
MGCYRDTSFFHVSTKSIEAFIRQLDQLVHPGLAEILSPQRHFLAVVLSSSSSQALLLLREKEVVTRSQIWVIWGMITHLPISGLFSHNLKYYNGEDFCITSIWHSD